MEANITKNKLHNFMSSLLNQMYSVHFIYTYIQQYRLHNAKKSPKILVIVIPKDDWALGAFQCKIVTISYNYSPCHTKRRIRGEPTQSSFGMTKTKAFMDLLA